MKNIAYEIEKNCFIYNGETFSVKKEDKNTLKQIYTYTKTFIFFFFW
jgi:hypothetical protein